MSTCTSFTDTTTIPIEETMGAMQELVDTGKIQFIGVSNFMLHELKNAQKAMTRYQIVSSQFGITSSTERSTMAC